MARRRRSFKREIIPDARFGSPVIARLVKQVMRRGKKSAAEHVVYGALDQVGEITNEDPIEVFHRALDNVKPQVEVKSRRVGGATYQVPMEVVGDRQYSLAFRWIIQYARSRKGVPMGKALAMELVDAAKNQGAAIKKRDETHKMAAANRAFAHYRW